MFREAQPDRRAEAGDRGEELGSGDIEEFNKRPLGIGQRAARHPVGRGVERHDEAEEGEDEPHPDEDVRPEGEGVLAWRRPVEIDRRPICVPDRVGPLVDDGLVELAPRLHQLLRAWARRVQRGGDLQIVPAECGAFRDRVRIIPQRAAEDVDPVPGGVEIGLGSAPGLPVEEAREEEHGGKQHEWRDPALPIDEIQPGQDDIEDVFHLPPRKQEVRRILLPVVTYPPLLGDQSRIPV